MELVSRHDFHPESKVKTIPFRSVVSVACDKDATVRGNIACPFTFKFFLVLINGKTELFAKS